MAETGGETVTTFKMKRSAASQALRTFNAYITKNVFTIDECYLIMSMFWLNADVIASWTTLFALKIKNGDLLLSADEVTHFKSDMVSEFAQSRLHLDPTSRLLMEGSSPTLESEKTLWNQKFPECLVTNFARGSFYGIVEGVPRSGKTSIAVSLMKLLIEIHGFDILTNIAIRNKIKEIKYCPTLSKLVKNMATSEKWIAMLDESGVYVIRKRALSVENIDFESLARFIGKLGGRLLLVTHNSQLDVPPLLLSWITEAYRKNSLNEVFVNLGMNNREAPIHMNRLVTAVPDCEYNFITEDITGLKFDISIKKLLSDIQLVKGKRKQEEGIVDWLKSSKSKKISDKDIVDKATIAFALVEDKLKNKIPIMTAYFEAGQELGLNAQTIRQYHGFIKKVEDEKKDKKKQKREKDT